MNFYFKPFLKNRESKTFLSSGGILTLCSVRTQLKDKKLPSLSNKSKTIIGTWVKDYAFF